MNEVLGRYQGLFLEETCKEMEKEQSKAALKESKEQENHIIALGKDGGFGTSDYTDSSVAAAYGDNSNIATDKTKQSASAENSPSDTAPQAN